MLRPLLTLTLISAITLPVAARPDPPQDKHERKEQKRQEKEDKKYWHEHDKREQQYWKEKGKEAHDYDRYHYHQREEDRDHHDWDYSRPRHQHAAPPWMRPYWREGEARRYVALVPGDPSRCYVFVDGRWVLRLVSDPRARLDLEGAYGLPAVPPPIAPPRVGLNFHIVLFN